MVFFGKDLAGPTTYAAADQNKARKANSRTRYKARKTKRDPEGEQDWPRRAGRHLDGFSWAPFLIPNIHYDSPPNEVHDCKDHDPHAIYEVPIKSNYAEALTLPRVNPAE